MLTATFPVLMRMAERSLIVVGGILSIYLGYRLFVLGIDKSQGQASAFGIELRNFGPGLFFAALGAVILVTAMRAAIQMGPELPPAPERSPAAAVIGAPAVSSMPQAFFFGIEDPTRQLKKWSVMAFFLETRDLLRRLDQGEAPDKLTELREAILVKLDSITMTPQELERYTELTNKVPLSDGESRELQSLDQKLVP